MGRLVVVSNRIADPRKTAAGGLAIALAEVLNNTGGRLAWVGHAVRNDDETAHMQESQGADRRTAALMMPTIE